MLARAIENSANCTFQNGENPSTRLSLFSRFQLVYVFISQFQSFGLTTINMSNFWSNILLVKNTATNVALIDAHVKVNIKVASSNTGNDK